jgi:cell division ATPase FtsA
MRAFLVDFQTAERIKRGLGETGDIQYKNVLGMEETTSSEAVTAAISEPMENLAKAIAQQVVEVNGGTPSAVFLAGGGSKLIGLREKVAESLHMDDKRVAIAGNNFSMSAFSETLELENPEYATPLGIAVSAGLGLLNDSYVVTLNGQPAKLFRNGVLTLRDILLMNGYVYADMLGKTGKSLCVTLNGKRTAFRGDPAVPATLRVNGTDAPLAYIVHAGDQIQFIPAKNGADARRTLGQLLGEGFHGRVLVNEREVPLDTPLRQEDVILTSTRRSSGGEKNLEKTPRESTRKNAAAPTLHVTLNQSPLELAPKESGMPYLLMDLLQYSGLDTEHLDNTVKLEVNGMERGFQYELKDNDTVTICCA